MAAKVRYKPRNAIVGNNSRTYILVALYRFCGIGVDNLPVVVDGVRRIYSVLGWTFYARYAFAVRLGGRSEEDTREIKTEKEIKFFRVFESLQQFAAICIDLHRRLLYNGIVDRLSNNYSHFPLINCISLRFLLFCRLSN